MLPMPPPGLAGGGMGRGCGTTVHDDAGAPFALQRTPWGRRDEAVTGHECR